MRYSKHRLIVIAGMLAVVAAIIASMERSRRRRAIASRLPAAEPLPSVREAPAPVALPASATSAKDRHARLSRAEVAPASPRPRRRTRASAAAGASVAVIALVLGLLRTGGVPSASASLSVEPVTTGDGTMVVAHARDFAPETPIELHWHESSEEAVHAVTSASGEVIAAVSVPAMDTMSAGGQADRPMELVATDGTHEASVSVQPATLSGGAVDAGAQVAAGSLGGMTLAAMPARRPRKATSTPTSTTPPTATQTPVATVAFPSPSPTPQGSVIVFGRTSGAGFNDPSDWGYVNGALTSLASPGNLASLSVDVGATSGTGHIRLALYADASGAPGALIAETSAASAQTGWNTLATTTNPAIPAGLYWIAAQTDDPATVYRMASGLTAGDAVGWAAQTYGAFPASVSGWLAFSGQSFSMYGTVFAAGVGAGGGSPATPPPVQVPVGETVTPVNSATSTSTPQPPTATAVPPTSTPTSGSGFTCPLNPAGGSQCGTPRYFCDTWTGGFCNDFRDVQTATHIPFPRPSDGISLDLMDTSDPGYGYTDCCTDGAFMSQAFLANEHFMVAWTSANFGDAVMRVHRPFDFAGRTGHVHFDVDLKTRSRGYVRLTLSPELTKRGNDDRSGTQGGNALTYPPDALDIWFQGSADFGGGIGVTLNRNGGCGTGYCFKSTANSPFAQSMYAGHDNVRNSVDVYVSRTHLRFVIDGTQVWDTAIPDIGFDRAYVYLQQAQYNPCKEGPWPHEVWPDSPLDQCSMAAQMFHWDNIAFDGPSLASNGLTPAGSEDVVFNAYSATSCSVKGVPAAHVGAIQQYTWISWTARLPAGTPVTLADVSCQYNFVSNGSDTPRGLEIVQPGG